MAVRKSSRTKGQGIHGEPAFVLHRYEWSESSLILELFTRNLGRVVAVAKGVRKPASSFRSVLLPFQPLLVSLGAQAQIRTLKGAEWVGGYAMATGQPLLLGFYLNELLMRLLVREDAYPVVFDAYTYAMAVIASADHENVKEPALRAFELQLLSALGFLPQLDRETVTQQILKSEGQYILDPENGVIPLQNSPDTLTLAPGVSALTGAYWRQMQEALNGTSPSEALTRVISQGDYAELKGTLRNLLNHHAGGPILKTRQLMKNWAKQKS